MSANRHQATVAAIRSAYGHRLTPADYRDMLNLRSVPEIVSYLKETYTYGELLSGLEPAFTHRGHLEMLLNRSIFMQCLHFCKLEHLQNTPFYRFFIYEYEIKELVKKLQLLPSGTDVYIQVMHTWLDPYLSFSLDQLVRADTLDAVIEVLSHTPYAAVLRKLRQPDGTLRSYTECEIALRSCYLERLLKEAEQTIHGSDLEALRDLIGEQVDLINLINAYRLKRVFQADSKTLHSMMLPVNGRLPKRICEQIYDAPDINAFFEVVRGTRYGRMLGTLPDSSDSAALEQAFQTLRCRNARTALRFSGHAAVSLYAVHLLCQIEVRNLITLIEGIRYSKPASYIQNLLITES